MEFQSTCFLSGQIIQRKAVRWMASVLVQAIDMQAQRSTAQIR